MEWHTGHNFYSMYPLSQQTTNCFLSGWQPLLFDLASCGASNGWPLSMTCSDNNSGLPGHLDQHERPNNGWEHQNINQVNFLSFSYCCFQPFYTGRGVKLKFILRIALINPDSILLGASKMERRARALLHPMRAGCYFKKQKLCSRVSFIIQLSN